MKRIFLTKAHPKVVVFGNMSIQSVSSHFIKAFLPDEHGIVCYGTNQGDDLLDIRIVFWKIILFQKLLSGSIDENEIRSEDIDRCMALEKCDLRCDPFWESDIVAIEVGDIFPSGVLHTPIARKTDSSVPIVAEESNPSIPLSIMLDYRRTVITRRIVNNDELKIGVGLSKEAFNTLIQISRRIIHGQYY